MNAAWNTEGTAKVTIRGNSHSVEVGSNFAETILEFARNESLGKFRVFLNGQEVQPEDAKEFFEDGDEAEVRPYDWAG